MMQHEMDHLDGNMYVDRMDSRSLCGVWCGMHPQQQRLPLKDVLMLSLDGSRSLVRLFLGFCCQLAWGNQGAPL
jgi:hypothetical protein